MIITGRHLAGAIFTLATFLAACGEDSSGTSIDAPKTIDSPVDDIDAPVDASIDAPPGDGGFSGACTTATCYALDPGTSPTPITTHDETEDAPTLTGTGGAALDGDYTLATIDVYPKGSFSALVSSATVSDNGESNGTSRFDADLWGYFLSLDIHYTFTVGTTAYEGDATQTLRGGGCFTVSGASLTTETGRCDEGWPDGVTPPSDYQVQYDDATGAAKLKITLPKEFLISLVPPGNQTIAGLAITGPIVFLLSFQKNGI